MRDSKVQEVARAIQGMLDVELSLLAQYMHDHYGLTFQGLLEEMKYADKR